MRKYTSYILSALAAVFMAGCMDIDVNPVEDQGPSMVRLQLTNADLVATRAVTDDNLYNEDLIESVQCFFAKTGSDDILHSTGLIEVNQNQTGTLNFQLPSDVSTTLFDGTANCDVYVLANYGTALNESSISSIKGKAITLGTGATQNSFVMDGKTALTLSGTSVSGTVSLVRAAAKIVVRVSVDKSIEDGGITWTPDIDAITMTYDGSVNGSKISALPADADASTEVRYAQSAPVFTADAENTTDEMYVGYQTVPFYSFPVAAAQNEGEIAMIIPWSPDGGEAVNFKYQIPVDIEFLRNSVHVINVHVAVLGNVDGTTLEASYKVVEWTDNEITAALSKPKYLVVEEKQVDLFNQSSYSIAYASSDDVTVTVDKIEFESYKYATTRTVTITSNSVAVNPEANNLTVNDRYTDYRAVKVKEENTNNGVVDFSHTMLPGTIVVQKIYITVQHTGDSKYSEQIVITQYPSIYLKSDPSNGYVYINGTGPGSTGSGSSTVYDDSRNSIGSIAGRGGITGSDSGTNVNRNMYNVYISSLPDGNANLVGDPRVTEGATLSGINELDNYRMTRTDAVNVIAPAFKIASSYGKTTTMSYNSAQKRCASYQEDGYPAGRWRIPTQAEIEFMQERALNGDIPSLFNGIFSDGGWFGSDSGTGYWAADGSVYWPDYDSDGDPINWKNPGFYTPTEMGSTSQSVRCVYDIWYWGEDQYPGAAQRATWAD